MTTRLSTSQSVYILLLVLLLELGRRLLSSSPGRAVLLPHSLSLVSLCGSGQTTSFAARAFLDIAQSSLPLHGPNFDLDLKNSPFPSHLDH